MSEDEYVDFDFDQSWAERKTVSPKIRAFGKVYELPPNIPAKLILILTRLQKTNNPNDEVPIKDLMEMLNLTIGKNNVEELMNSGLDMEQLEQLMEKVNDIYAKRVSGGNSKNG
jgi:hypothetical protein